MNFLLLWLIVTAALLVIIGIVGAVAHWLRGDGASAASMLIFAVAGTVLLATIKPEKPE